MNSPEGMRSLGFWLDGFVFTTTNPSCGKNKLGLFFQVDTSSQADSVSQNTPSLRLAALGSGLKLGSNRKISGPKSLCAALYLDGLVEYLEDFVMGTAAVR